MFDLLRFIAACRNALEKADPALAVHKIMSEAVATPTAIEAALSPGEIKEDKSAQYIFLHQSPELTILKVVMPGRLMSPPHNHLVWTVIGMYEGRENNVFYRRNGDRLVEVSRRELIAPEVMTLAPDAIHGIANPLATRSCALHVYGGTLANPARSLWNPFTLQEEAFQLPNMLKYEQEMTERAVGRLN